MASCRLGRWTDDPDDLPDVCMRCGSETDRRVNKTFSWIPSWTYVVLVLAGPLIFVIVALVVRRRQKVAVPLCDDHKNHWLNRGLLMAGSLFVLAGLGLALTIAFANLPPHNPLHDLTPVPVIVGVVAWLVVAVAASVTQIRPEEISDRGIKLAGVCEEFVDAYEDFRGRRSRRRVRREAFDRWEDRERDRRVRRAEDRYQEEEDDEPRPRRRGRQRERDEDDY